MQCIVLMYSVYIVNMLLSAYSYYSVVYYIYYLQRVYVTYCKLIYTVYYDIHSFLATQVFASHSLWHLCVLGAVYVSFHFYIQYQALLKHHGCAAYGYSTDSTTGVAAAVFDTDSSGALAASIATSSTGDMFGCDITGAGNGTCDIPAF